MALSSRQPYGRGKRRTFRQNARADENGYGGGGAVAGLHAKCGIVDRKRQRGRGDVV